MVLGSLRICHLAKRASVGVEFETTRALLEPVFKGAFRMETCQRTVWVYPSFLVTSERFKSDQSPLPVGVEFLEGADAYAFLLNMATGLLSEVRGETDVFGQMKEFWSEFERASLSSEAAAPVFSALQPWIQKMYEDTKEIRAHYLQNVGAGSYGSLVRKLQRARFGSASGEPVLLVGAGQIAISIAPWLVGDSETGEGELWLWNRSEENLKKLEAEIRKKLPRCRIKILPQNEGALLWALNQVPTAVFAIPSDGERDLARVQAWTTGSRSRETRGESTTRLLVHLGGMRSALPVWSELTELLALDDLFALQKNQEASRSEQFARAERACLEKARLRALSDGGSASLPHGWEDLAVFA